MKNILFDENGMLCIDEAVMKQPTFIKIMEDGIVTEEELAEQSKKVTELLKKVETLCSDEEIEAIKDLLVETSVLHAIYQYHNIQNLKL